MESLGTKAYTRAELKTMFRNFWKFNTLPILTTIAGRPSWLNFPKDGPGS